MTNLIASELFKLRTTRTFYALLGASLALVLLPTIPVAAFVDFGDGSDSPVEILLFFLGGLVQTFALLIGVLAVTNEFRHGTITPSLLVAPNRLKLMSAKLVAALIVGLIMGIVSTGLIIGIVGFFASTRDFANPGDKFAMFIGGSLTTALYAALGVGIGALIRNQVGAVVGALVYIFVLEPILGGVLSLWNAADNIMPRYSLGAVSNALAGLDVDDSTDLLSQAAGGLLLLLYAAIFIGLGFLLTQRRDITA
jgi:ABC-2 type transport system permease protein